ncbi:hypothetical protein GX50_01001 [[Emmonsia] crescens]|uniref:Uncharacterized protein n=1 Tax=[Emmonsia] crescens TaxID=73230 RepID=A0A2B7ZQ65_9EURO|nr:hypothetical protein GX50_01001 [Emmonsia crescens]
MIGYPSSHQHALSRPVEVSVNTYQCSEPVQHTPSLDNCEVTEKRQSVWSAFWLEERPQAHVSPLCTFARRVLQQLLALRRRLLTRTQSMWAATNSACRRIRELAPFPCDSQGQPDIEKQFFRETKTSSLRSTLPTTTPAFGRRHSGNRFRRSRKTMGLKPGLSYKAEAMQQTRHSKASNHFSH